MRNDHRRYVEQMRAAPVGILDQVPRFVTVIEGSSPCANPKHYLSGESIRSRMLAASHNTHDFTCGISLAARRAATTAATSASQSTGGLSFSSANAASFGTSRRPDALRVTTRRLLREPLPCPFRALGPEGGDEPADVPLDERAESRRCVGFVDGPRFGSSCSRPTDLCHGRRRQLRPPHRHEAPRHRAAFRSLLSVRAGTHYPASPSSPAPFYPQVPACRAPLAQETT